MICTVLFHFDHSTLDVIIVFSHEALIAHCTRPTQHRTADGHSQRMGWWSSLHIQSQIFPSEVGRDQQQMSFESEEPPDGQKMPVANYY